MRVFEHVDNPPLLALHRELHPVPAMLWFVRIQEGRGIVARQSICRDVNSYP